MCDPIHLDEEVASLLEDGEAMYALAMYYRKEPVGSLKQDQKIAYWLDRAVEKDHPKAMFQLGELYLGWCRDKELMGQKGYELLIRAAKHQKIQSWKGEDLYALGMAINRFSKNDQTGMGIIKMAARKQNTNARIHLAKYYVLPEHNDWGKAAEYAFPCQFTSCKWMVTEILDQCYSNCSPGELDDFSSPRGVQEGKAWVIRKMIFVPSLIFFNEQAGWRSIRCDYQHVVETQKKLWLDEWLASLPELERIDYFKRINSPDKTIPNIEEYSIEFTDETQQRTHLKTHGSLDP